MMKVVLCALLALVIVALASPAGAETERYVKDTIRISIKNAPDDKSAQKGVLTSGDKVSILKISGGWSQVKTTNGTEGWVATSMLVDTPPAGYLYGQLEEKYQKLQEDYQATQVDLVKLQADNESLKELVEGGSEQTKKYIALVEGYDGDIGELFSIKQNYDKAAKQLATTQSKLENLEKMASKAVFYNYLRWFLSGAGVLVLGFLIGMLAKRSGRKYY